MEQLVTFLTSNIQFVIVIVGILYFLFFRKSSLEKRAPNRMPEFRGEVHGQPERPSRPRPLPSEVRPDLAAERPHNVSYAPQESYSEPAGDEPQEFVSPPLRTAVSRRAEVQGAGKEGDLSNRDLARAVLWSEILGRPRARKPYRR